MFNSSLPESDLLKTVLDPLLDDFEHWFFRSRTLLESQKISFLEDEKQANLLKRLIEAEHEVSIARALLKVTDGQAGVETSVLMTWHQLVSECWQISLRARSEKSI